MEPGEWIAIGVAGVSLSVTLFFEVMRIRREDRREAATDRRFEESAARSAAQRNEQFLLELQIAVDGLYQAALEHLGPGNGGYATASLLKLRLVHTGQMAEHAPGDAGAMSAYFVKRCGEIIGWIERGAAQEEKDLLRGVVGEAFESAVRAIAALRAEFRGPS